MAESSVAEDGDRHEEQKRLPALPDDVDGAEGQLEELLSRLPEQTDPGLKREIAVLTRQMHHSGPLPSPQMLEHYMRLMPDAGERIFSMAEREQNMRASDNTKIIHNDRIKIYGSIFVSSALIGAGVYCGIIGEPWLGGVLGTSGAVGGMVRALWGQRPEKEHSSDE